MEEESKTREKLISELAEARQNISELEKELHTHDNMEDILMKSEDRYRILAESAQDVIWELDLSLRYTYVSPSVTKIMGYTVEEAMAKSLDQILTPESYRQAKEIIKEELSRELISQRPSPEWSYTGGQEMIRKDGSSIWTEVTLNILYDENDKPKGLMGITRDITKRKQAEGELRRSEEKYRTILDIMEEGYAELDLRGTCTFANNSCCTLMGYERDEFIGMNYRSYCSPETARFMNKIFRRIFETGRPEFLVDHDIIIKGGEIRTHQASVALMKDHLGRSVGFHVLVRDVTDRKRAEEALRKSEETFSKVFHANPVAIAITRMSDGLLIDTNESLRKLLGYHQKDSIGKTTKEMNIWVHEEEREQIVKSLSEKQPVRDEEFHFRTKKGDVITARYSAEVIDIGGEPCILSLLMDITERKIAEEKSRVSEEKFMKVFMTAPDCIAITRLKDGQIIDVNIGFEEITGWKRSEAIGKTSAEIDFWGDTGARELMVEDLKQGRDILSREFRFMRKDGSLRSGLYSARPIRIDGEACLIFILQDMTERQQLQEDRYRLEQQLFQSQKIESIGTLAGGIAHDFNNILSAIIGYTELAIDDINNTERLHTELKEVLKASDRAKDLVSQILTFSRKTETVHLPLELRSILKESLKMLRSVIPSTIEIRQEIAEPGFILSNPTHVNQIIMNLCTNAAHAMGKSAGVIDVSLKRVLLDKEMAAELEVAPGTFLKLVVSDTGHGMPPEVLKRIFEPYFTTKEQGHGTGLGLSVVHGIVKSHGGSVLCRSIPNEGTTFEVYLPEIVSEKGETALSAKEPVPTGTERILVIDDEAALTGLAEEMLGRLGYNVTIRTRSDEALDSFKENPNEFDLIITDMTMPGITGDRLAQKILEIRPDIPIILCSGYSEHISEEKVKSIGIREFVMKPIELKELARTIRKVLDRRI